MTDTELLDGLEAATREGVCPALIFDDNGRWAVADEGTQSIPEEWRDDRPGALITTFSIPAEAWRDTLRAALHDYLVAHAADKADWADNP